MVGWGDREASKGRLYFYFISCCTDYFIISMYKYCNSKKHSHARLFPLAWGFWEGGVSGECAVLQCCSHLEQSKEDQCLCPHCFLGIVATNPAKRGVGKRGGGRGVSGQLWENKGSVSSPLGLGAALKCCRMVGVGWGGVEEHGDDGEVGGRRQRLRFEGCPGWSCTLTWCPAAPWAGSS